MSLISQSLIILNSELKQCLKFVTVGQYMDYVIFSYVLLVGLLLLTISLRWMKMTLRSGKVKKHTSLNPFPSTKHPQSSSRTHFSPLLKRPYAQTHDFSSVELSLQLFLWCRSSQVACLEQLPYTILFGQWRSKSHPKRKEKSNTNKFLQTSVMSTYK